ncbi:hypothetical protein EXIGLDRAFT_749316 [Exidia glandulosa HHB12029]|uniref:Uncharacterized protein n=1 Tax=Exidia glandulosa HHB12029 TaxID=1314781 RepID=A0A165I8M1_EXIGL|nr:hypothetical protein EXIGLDRAFT_749316 [Exidia glandulosa HHB12029]
MSTIHDLPLEMLEEILIAIDELATLKVAVLSYRPFYNIYKGRKHVIHPRVLRNSLGGDDVIASYLRTIYIETFLHNYSQRNPAYRAHPAQFIQDIQLLREDTTNTPTASEYAICVKRTRVFQQLEVLYSRSEKDRLTDKTSRLSPGESKRFRTALHRLWLLGLYTRSDSVVQTLCMTAATRVPLFYDGYTAQDVYDIHCVLDWLEELVIQCLPVELRNEFHVPLRLICLSVGPLTVLKAYLEPRKARARLQNSDTWRRNSHDAWKEDLLPVFKAHRLLSLTENVVKIPREIKPIVVLPDVSNLQCWLPTCGAQSGVRFWNEYNWNYAPRKLRLETLGGWLKGPFDTNKRERSLLQHFLGAPDEHPRGSAARRKHRTLIEDALEPAPDMTLERVLHALCDLPAIVQHFPLQLQTHLQQCQFYGVTSKDLLCETCLYDMIDARLWVWWVAVNNEAAQENGDSEDCWYGFDCRLQDLKPDHAYRYRHACFDTQAERQAAQEERLLAAEEEETEILCGEAALPIVDGMSMDVDDTSPAPPPAAAPSTPTPAQSAQQSMTAPTFPLVA